jgi:hypothetical protein
MGKMAEQVFAGIKKAANIFIDGLKNNSSKKSL